MISSDHSKIIRDFGMIGMTPYHGQTISEISRNQRMQTKVGVAFKNVYHTGNENIFNAKFRKPVLQCHV